MTILDRILDYQVTDADALRLEYACTAAKWLWRTACIAGLIWFALAVLVPWLAWVAALKGAK